MFQEKLKMPYSKKSEINITLLNPNIKEGGRNALKLYIAGAVIFLLLQIVFLFMGLGDNLKQNFIILSYMLFFEFLYILLFIFIKTLSKSKLSKMFIQSILLNVGMLFTLVFVSPFIVLIFINYFEIFKIYISALLFMLLIAWFYTKELNVTEIINDSLSTKFSENNGDKILFSPEHAPFFLKKFSILLYLPYVVSLILAFYAFIKRTGDESLFSLTISMLIMSSLLLYSEFCYFFLWIKYILSKNKNPS